MMTFLFCEGLLAKPTHGNIIRFAPPLVINEEEVSYVKLKLNSLMKIIYIIFAPQMDRALEILFKVFRSV